MRTRLCALAAFLVVGAAGTRLLLGAGSPQPHSHALPHNVPDLCPDGLQIPAGTTTTLERGTYPCMAVYGTLRLEPEAKITVGTLLVYPQGALEGTTGELVIADRPLDLTHDPEQFGTGLLVFGRVTIHAAMKTPFVRLAAPALASQSQLSLGEAVSGWQSGDRLLLPDSRQINGAAPTSDRLEETTIAAVTADGRSVTLSAPLRYAHDGAYDADGITRRLLPHVLNVSRRFVIRSENPAGTRGHVLLSHRAVVSISGARFVNLGRTRGEPVDSTTFELDEQRQPTHHVTHIGTNQIGRYALHLHHLLGPRGSNGPQFSLVNNVVEDARKWGITLHASSFGRVEGNVVYRAVGSGIMTEDGSERDNVIRGNFVLATKRGPQDPDFKKANAGEGFWFRSPFNIVEDNVTANNDFGGFTYFMQPTKSITVLPSALAVPAFAGADQAVAAEQVVVNPRAAPLRSFARNETYSNREVGLNVWVLGGFSISDGKRSAPGDSSGRRRGRRARGRPRTEGRLEAGAAKAGGPLPRSLVQDLTVWHVGKTGVTLYNANDVTFERLVLRGDVRGLTPGTARIDRVLPAVGWAHSRNARANLLRQPDIQGFRVGIAVPPDLWDADGDQTLRIDGGRLRNHVDLRMTLPVSVANGGQRRHVVVTDTRFELLAVSPTSAGPAYTIMLAYDSPFARAHSFVWPQSLTVHRYNGAAESWRIYWPEQAPAAIVPPSTTVTIGCPGGALTNADCRQQYGVAVGGDVATCSVTRPEIRGFVCSPSGVQHP